MKAGKSLLGAVEAQIANSARVDASEPLYLVCKSASLKPHLHELSPDGVQERLFFCKQLFDFVIELGENG